MSNELDDLDRELSSLDRQNLSGAARSGMKVLPIAVALVALLSFSGVIYYAYNQGVRSGSEEAAPLLTTEGPAKVQPQDPGGMQIPHQDKLVYNRVEESQDDTKIERLLPQPESPTKPPVPEEEVVVPETTTGPSLLNSPDQTENLTTETRKGTDGTPRPPEPQSPEEPRLPDPDLAAPTAPPTVGSSADKAETKVAAAKTEVKEGAPKKVEKPVQQAAISTKPIDTKAWRIQISAVKSEQAARTEWQRQANKNKDLLGSLSLQIQTIEIKGKGTFFRVRGGPLKDKAAAQALCASLKKRKVGCIIVKPDA